MFEPAANAGPFANNQLASANTVAILVRIRDEPVGELHHEAHRWAVPELGAIGFQQVLLGLREQ
jgi:hypothetical protein